MSLSKALTSKFAKITKAEKNEVKESTLYGTIAKLDDVYYVIFDGSTLLTPVETTVDFEDGERVTVLLKNHVATVIGNISNPSSSSKTVKLIGERVSTCETEIKKTPENVTVQVTNLVQSAIDNGKFLTESQFQSLFEASAKDIVGAVEELEGDLGDLAGDVSDNTNLINNTNVHRGTTPPANPVAGKTLWVDYSATPPLLKRYTSSATWETIGTDKFKTSYIQIQSDSVDIGSGGKVNIKSGAGFSVESGGSVAIKSGGSFTVDAANLDIDAQGVITAKKAALTEATINGNMFVNGFPALHTGNIAIGSSAPSNPTVGMVWINPSNNIIQCRYTTFFVVNSANGQYYLPFDTSGGQLSVYATGIYPASLSSGVTYTYTYTVKIPIRSNNHHGPHYVMVRVDYTDGHGPKSMRFPIQTINTSGVTFYEQRITTTEWWLGSQTSVTIVATVVDSGGATTSSNNDLFGDPNYEISLEMIATPTSATGWQTATVKYFAG